MKRFVLVVLDGFGIGYTDDAAAVRPQDVGANTCKHILDRMPDLYLPHLERLGLMNALGYPAGSMQLSSSAVFGRSGLAHFGADTFYGHQEIMGTKPRRPVSLPFAECSETVKAALADAGYRVEYQGNGLRYLLVEGCVTVADNIEADPGQAFNVTGALDQIPFAAVAAIGRVVRKVVPVSRVIALGGKNITPQDLLGAAEAKNGRYIGVNCPRSGVYNTGYQVVHLGYGVDPAVQVPAILNQAGIPVILIGKVADIVENPGGVSISGIDTAEVMQQTVKAMAEHETAFIATNVQETDLAGHRQDVAWYADRLQVADQYIGRLMAEVRGDDILLVMADHGNDPTIGHSHHTREYVPLLCFGRKIKPGFIGQRTTLSDVGATIADYFNCRPPESGDSFLQLL